MYIYIEGPARRYYVFEKAVIHLFSIQFQNVLFLYITGILPFTKNIHLFKKKIINCEKSH